MSKRIYQRNRIFNKVTEKTLKQSQAGKNLKKFNTLEKLFEDLGILYSRNLKKSAKIIPKNRRNILLG